MVSASLSRAEPRTHLVISRRIGERTFIGDNVIVELIEITGQQARISIRAPRSMQILRDDCQRRQPREHQPLATSH